MNIIDVAKICFASLSSRLFDRGGQFFLSCTTGVVVVVVAFLVACLLFPCVVGRCHIINKFTRGQDCQLVNRRFEFLSLWW